MFSRWTDFDSSFGIFDELQRRMNRLFEEVEPGPLPVWARLTGRAWPLVNLFDTGEELVLKAEVPGLSEKDIRITGNQDVLTISGERKNEVPEGHSVHRQEREAVNFSRSFTFPCKVDLEKASAAVKDGILTVTLGKAAEAKPRQITVKAK